MRLVLPKNLLNSYMEKKFNTTSFEGRQWQVIYLFIYLFSIHAFKQGEKKREFYSI
jgi:hypothetical protein